MKQLLIAILILMSFGANAQDIPLHAQITNKAKDASIVSYSWAMLSGPSQITIVNAPGAINESALDATAKSPVAGVYKFEITVKDNFGLTGKSSVTVTVNRAAVAPSVDAGKDFTIQLIALAAAAFGIGLIGFFILRKKK